MRQHLFSLTIMQYLENFLIIIHQEYRWEISTRTARFGCFIYTRIEPDYVCVC
jgi:hypothetical protein